MRPRPIIPPGKAGVLVLAAATVPLLISRCKPFAKKMGEKMVEWGEKLQKEALKPEPSTETAPSNDEMKSTAKEAVNSASPPGKEEAKAAVTAEATAQKAPPKPKAKTPRAKKESPKGKPGVTTNPKKPDTKNATKK